MWTMADGALYYVYLVTDGGMRWPLVCRQPLAADEIPRDTRVECVGRFASEGAAWELFERLIE